MGRQLLLSRLPLVTVLQDGGHVLGHFQQILITANLLQSEHLLNFDVVTFEACDLARLDAVPQKARLGWPALKYFANDSERLKASLFLNWNHVSKMLHEAHNIGVTRILILPVEEPLSEGLVVANRVTFVHSNLDVMVNIS